MSSVRKDFLHIGLFGLVYMILALLVGNSYYLLIMTIVPVWAVMGLSWNLFSGYSGLVSFGHAAFFGLGAYLVALCMVVWDLNPWLTIMLATAVGGLSALLVGIPTFRLRGHYFALAMLAYPLALLYIFEWLGYQEVALPMKREMPVLYMQFENPVAYIALALALLLAALGITSILSHSRFGMSLLAIKLDEDAAEAAGINTLYWKLIAITISGALAGAAGGFYAVVLLVVTPLAVFGMLVSAQALIFAMFGGVGTLWGPVLGAFILVPLSELLYARYAADFPGIQGVIYGVAIIAVILFAPEGILWKVRSILKPGQFRMLGSTASITDLEADESLLAVSQSGAGEKILEVAGVSKAFGGLQATDQLSFAVKSGELLGIIGPNGAGKTTLFNLLNGFIKPDKGEITFQGQSLMKKRPNKICAMGIARTFQVAKPFTHLSVLDNVVIGAYVHTRSKEEASRHASAAIKLVGLENQCDLPGANLTNKELRLMELARALASLPKLILVDEILAGLDPDAMQEMLLVLEKVRKLGITIVIIEHSMQAMVKLVDRFIVLDHGALLAEGRPEEIVKNPQVIEAYLGKKWLEND
ncbi:MAG: branched-chain amino acid ABC transporter ATP-binding protein/permease [Gammaproteobacteria bacterium]|jgi:branched-chain amino acid transport system permease protein|nr:branched-chain amino acid ABC transporter ATP-binding protein/permease [Gammaproteobacteria bacterium]MBT6043195.1 branched-chain amino acid ABC transporter ATP-binding protein/permease [Gammaproteobacteria bacterium]